MRPDTRAGKAWMIGQDDDRALGILEIGKCGGCLILSIESVGKECQIGAGSKRGSAGAFAGDILSRSGPSLSIGHRGGWFTIGPRGRRATVGFPGMALFWTERDSPDL